MRSLPWVRWLSRCDSLVIVPEKTRNSDSLPANGSAIVLNT